MKKLIFFILMTKATFSFSVCLTNENSQSLKLKPSKLVNIELNINTCFINENNGIINIKVKQNGKNIQLLNASFESDAYVLSADADFDIDLDGVPDLSISTGKGRNADGMHYWRFDAKKLRYLDLGEAPALKHDVSSDVFNLIALVTSSGDFQSIRYNYIIEENKIKLISALGFIPNNNSKIYEIVKLKPVGDSINWQHGKKISVKSEIAKKCMDGSGKCP